MVFSRILLDARVGKIISSRCILLAEVTTESPEGLTKLELLGGFPGLDLAGRAGLLLTLTSVTFTVLRVVERERERVFVCLVRDLDLDRDDFLPLVGLFFALLGED